MSKCTARNLEFLKSISKCNKLSRKESLTSCSNDNIKAISEIALNTLKGNLKLTPLQIRQLKKQKKRSSTSKQDIISKGEAEAPYSTGWVFTVPHSSIFISSWIICWENYR
jgi:hypothetical protein